MASWASGPWPPRRAAAGRMHHQSYPHRLHPTPVTAPATIHPSSGCSRAPYAVLGAHHSQQSLSQRPLRLSPEQPASRMFLGSLTLYSAAKRRMASSVELRSRTCVPCQPGTGRSQHRALRPEARAMRTLKFSHKKRACHVAQHKPAHLGGGPRQLRLVLGPRQQSHHICSWLRFKCRKPAQVALLVACTGMHGVRRVGTTWVCALAVLSCSAQQGGLLHREPAAVQRSVA